MQHRQMKRTATTYWRIAWLLVPIIAVGGLFYPPIGLAVIVIMITMMVLGLVRGRYWCGKLCPHGSLFDLITPISVSRRIPRVFRTPALKWLFFALFMTLFVSRIVGAFGHYGQSAFVSQLGSVFVLQYLVWPTIVGLVLAVIISPRTWCWLCPMGTFQQIMHQAGTALGLAGNNWQTVTLSKPDRCAGCGLCSRACSMQLEPHRNWNNGQFRDNNCIQCSACNQSCPLSLSSPEPVEPGEGTSLPARLPGCVRSITRESGDRTARSA